MRDPLKDTKYRSFTRSDTNFTLVRSETPIDVDGFKLGEMTGLVQCDECEQTGQNVDEIPHRDGCSQSDVHSWYWLVVHGFIDATDVPSRYQDAMPDVAAPSSAPYND